MGRVWLRSRSRKEEEMKKGFILGMLVFCLLLTGCFKKDNLEDISIYTTAYPIEYIMNELYGEHSTVQSIYPNNTDIETYEPTEKQLKDYSSSQMFVFNGLGKEQDFLLKMVKDNKNLMIIDATRSIETQYNSSELWLDPSNFLMMASNMKTGLLAYVTNHYLKSEIETKYDDLKIKVSNLDASLKLMSSNSTYNTLLVDNDALLFLEKYGFRVISIASSENLTAKLKKEIYNLIEKKQLNYVYTLDKEQVSDIVKELQVNTNIEVLELHKLDNLSDKERSDGQNYISLLTENIDLLKKEAYK